MLSVHNKVKCSCLKSKKDAMVQQNLYVQNAGVGPSYYAIEKCTKTPKYNGNIITYHDKCQMEDSSYKYETKDSKSTRTQTPKMKRRQNMMMGDFANDETTLNRVSFRDSIQVFNEDTTKKRAKNRKWYGNEINSYDVNIPNKEKRKSKSPNVSINLAIKNKGKCGDGTCTNNDNCFMPLDCTCNANGLKNGTMQYDRKISKIVERTDRCKEGICVDSSKKQETNFICKCQKRRQKIIPVCNENSCKNHPFSAESENLDKKIFESDTTIVNLKKKIICLCRRYSQKLREKIDRNTCENGVCRTLGKRSESFVCNCTRITKLKKCSDETCSKIKKKCIQIKSPTIGSEHNTSQELKVSTRNKVDQTGDPLIEMKLNSVDMCLLNPSQTLGKITSLGKPVTSKRGPCPCPSHAHLMSKYRRQDLNPCYGGTCERAKKNKKTNFSCKCLKKRILICSEESCKSNKNNKNEYNFKAVPNQSQAPLFEMRLDPDSMCLLNAKDVRKKIKLLDMAKAKGDHTCPGGVCRDNSRRRDIKMFCKCKYDHDPIECVNATCNQPIMKTITKKSSINEEIQSQKYNKANDTPDTISQKSERARVRKVLPSENIENQNNNSSNFKLGSSACVLSRLFKICLDKSENIMCNKHKRGVIDTNSAVKWCRGLICTPSNNINDKNALKIDVYKKNIPTCDCSECKIKDRMERHHMTSGNNQKIKINNQSPDDCYCCTCGKIKSLCTCKLSKETSKRIHVNKSEPTTENSYEKRKKIISPERNLPRSTNTWTSVRDHQCQCYLTKVIIEKNKPKNKSIARLDKRKRRLEKKYRDQDKARKDKMIKKAVAQDEKYMKQVQRRKNAEMKKEQKIQQQQLKSLQAQIEGKEQLHDTSCCADFVLGTLKLGVKIIRSALSVLFMAITKPRTTYHMAKMRVLDPLGTYDIIKMWWFRHWELKKLEIARSVGGSEKMTILLDTLQDSPIYQAFAPKGRTKKEKQEYQRECLRRKRRIRKRDNTAKYSCQHALLTTLRRHPCFWVYHICPGFYPQCLSYVAFMRNFGYMMIFLAAVVVWSPCILAFELCRACMCCLLCTG